MEIASKVSDLLKKREGGLAGDQNPPSSLTRSLFGKYQQWTKLQRDADERTRSRHERTWIGLGDAGSRSSVEALLREAGFLSGYRMKQHCSFNSLTVGTYDSRPLSSPCRLSLFGLWPGLHFFGPFCCPPSPACPAADPSLLARPSLIWAASPMCRSGPSLRTSRAMMT